MLSSVSDSSPAGRPRAWARRRKLTGLVPIAALLAGSLLFYYRQNYAGQIGGKMSVAKLLWLDYAVLAWFVLPLLLVLSPRVSPALRRVYGVHLASFAARGLAELWMLYVVVSWIPPYGIAHDLAHVVLVTLLARRTRNDPASLRGAVDAAAFRFLTSLRVGLFCEMLFAWLFYRATGGKIGIYFASTDPVFSTINALTWAAVTFLVPDLLRTFWRCRDALFPLRRDRAP
ncbi:MAG TPA: hypothetical protein VNN77_14130 [candidate division Zixibacteria bacterium]|nr:hypothetical protein [candidate division Zixibacteria bacterium]